LDLITHTLRKVIFNWLQLSRVYYCLMCCPIVRCVLGSFAQDIWSPVLVKLWGPLLGPWRR
jgi:hypothetical protein